MSDLYSQHGRIRRYPYDSIQGDHSDYLPREKERFVRPTSQFPYRNNPSACHDVFPRSVGIHLLATGQYAPDSSGTTYAGLHPQEVKLRFTYNFLQSGTGILAPAFLDAFIHKRTAEQRISTIRQNFTRIPYQRSGNDWRGNTHFIAHTHHTRQ